MPRYAVRFRRALCRAGCLVFTCLLILPSMAGCRKKTPEGKAFRFLLDSDPRQLDPQVSTDRSSVTMAAALFEGLARLDENGEAEPAAATWTVSEDRRTYTFTLRESSWSVQTSRSDDNLWKSPTPVTAQDFVFGMQRAVLPETGSALAQELYGIEHAEEINRGERPVSDLGVRAVDENTLVITLVEPDDDFPKKTASTPYMPCNEAFFEHTGGRYGLEAEYVLTNGPFYVKSWLHGESITLAKNDGYHDAAAILPASVRFLMQAPDDPVSALAEGSLDAAGLTAAQADAAAEEGLELVRLQDTLSGVWLNNKIDALSVPSTRRALRDAIEWELLGTRLTAGGASVAAGYIPPDAVVSGAERYRIPDNARLPVSRGREALADFTAGLAQAGLSSCPGLTMLYADDEQSIELARYILQSWQKNLSVYFELVPLSPDELASRVGVGNYELALYTLTPSSLTAQGVLGGLAGTAAEGNLARYQSARFSEAFGRLAAGTSSRGEIDELEGILFEECPFIPLSFPVRTVGLGKTVTGVIVRPFSGGAFGAELDFRGAGKLD